MHFPVCDSLSVLLILAAVGVIALFISIVLTFVFLVGKKNVHLWQHLLLTVFYTLAVAALVLAVVYGIGYANYQKQPTVQVPVHTTTAPAVPDVTTLPTAEPTTEPTELPTDPPATEPPAPVNTLGTVAKTESSDPANWGVIWDIFKGNTAVDSYTREDAITFGDPEQDGYFALPGISTFRGDNYRSGASYGSVNITENALTTVWKKQTSSLSNAAGTGSWTGSGWTGQPIIVQWDAQTRQNMNLYPEKKEKEDLVEVIYATLDGHIYFYDLEDGSYTRDPLNVGMAFKGAGSLDPRGYPIMYVGSGDKTSSGKVPRMFIINLIDCTIAYEYGNDESLRHRSWIAFDSAPLVDAETDTLIWPGESGMLYTMKLNTVYDKEMGTLSISPDNIVKTRYSTSRGRTLGYEASAIAVEHYIYIADNGGMLFCVDLNTMELVWAQDVKDDINATPVFEWGDDGKGYLYIASSMEYANGTVYAGKIDASTGEYVWEATFDNVYYNYSVSGGVLSSPILGKKGTDLEGMVIYSISRTPTASGGLLVALDTASGEIVWQTTTNLYCWSSPVALYSDAGEAKIVLCDSAGNVMLIDGQTGEILTSIGLGSNIEASPAVFNDMLVVGTRGMLVCGVRIS